MHTPINRRGAIAALGAAAMTGALDPFTAQEERSAAPVRGRLNQSVARWCFARTPLSDLCVSAKAMGITGIDLLDEKDWAVPTAHGLRCAIANGFGSITQGFNRPDHHDELVAAGSGMIPRAAAAGIERIVVFSGNRAGLSDGEGIANCVNGLKRLMPLAEQHGVTLCMEMLNSKVDHTDYHADRTQWAAEVAAGVNSPRFRLLYDVYHMQVMEGDVIATIKRHSPIIAHYHTAGVPGRNEIDEMQELNYRRIATVVADSGFTGFVAHEFLPRRDAMTSLREAVTLCTV